MKLKRLLSMLLAVVLVVCTIPHEAFAEAAQDKVYSYVALGDSVTAGYGLGHKIEGTSMDKALILTEALIADPIMDAYPMVFGEMIKPLGQEKGFTTQSTNLAATAYRAQDIEKTIRETCKGEVAEMILEGFIGKGASAALLNYHNIYDQYIPDADLVSIELGGNDIVMAVLVPMFFNENPILQASALSLMLTLFGESAETALGAGYMTLSQNKDKITYSSLVEASEYLMQVGQNADTYVQNAVNQLEGVVLATKEKNPNANIALVGMFNPYQATGDEEKCLLDKIEDLICENLNNSALLLCESQDEQPEEVLCQALSEGVNEVEGDGEIILTTESDILEGQSLVSLDMFKEILKSKATSIVNQFAADNVEPQMLKLNELTKALADKYGAAFVDVWGISTGNDSDPHPDAQGHKEIAERMYAVLASLVGLQDAQVTKAPAAKQLTYTGSAQALVEPGEATGGEMAYSLDGTRFDAAVPTATGAGEYTVYYKVAGDKKHFDTKAESVKVTIAKAPISPKVTLKSWTYGNKANVASTAGNPGGGKVT
ncbi:MAG: hypothetical protein J6S63_01125, partial [Atopobiaceae bacterium]|nr:hypothetical protein [Atopobiaceae bacterium]